MKNMLTLVSLTVVLFSYPAQALDRCEADFKSGLIEMKAIFLRMTPDCQKEVDLGDKNEDNIQAKCSFSELGLALQMQSIENSRLAPLCQDAVGCVRLYEREVCVEGKPFSYYLGKFDL